VKASSESAYRAAGVDIDAQDDALAEIKGLARSTFGPEVLSDVGHFGGLFRLPLEGLEEPVLVASADGVGTKLMVARMVGDFGSVGVDLVNHCVNDILVQGARPLFFLDYVGAGRLEPEEVVSLVRGIKLGCDENGCALLGGELAEMPGLYPVGDYDLVGFIVGVVDRKRILDGSRIGPGDLLLGLPSSGLHTNGYSLARRILFEQNGFGVDDRLPGAESSLGDTLLATHRSYLRDCAPLLHHPGLHGLAHVTGGGLSDNLPRILPQGTHALIDVGRWEPPALFRQLQELGGVSTGEMFRVFNMGVGMVAVVAKECLAEISDTLSRGSCRPFVIGAVEAGGAGVIYRRDEETVEP